MAVTHAQETDILKVVVGLFNAAPGKDYLTEMANLVEGGMTIRQLADFLGAHTLFVNGMMGGKITTDAQVAVLMENFGVVADNNPESAGSQAQAYFTQQIDAGVGFGQIVYDAVIYLSVSPAVEFTAAATLLANKALVAASYSESVPSTDLNTLQDILSAVTGTAAYTEDDVAAILEGSTTTPPPVTGSPSSPSSVGKIFTLTTGIDNGLTFVGGAKNDTFNANSVGASGALGLLDDIDGGDGNDTLNVSDINAIALGAGQVFVNNIETINVTDAATVSLDTVAYTGLTALNILASNGADVINAAPTTAVSVVDTAAGGVMVDGGSSQTVSAVGAVTLGATTATTGAISVTETGAGQLATDIVIDGGSTVTVASAHNQGGLITIGGSTQPTGAVVVTTGIDAAQTGGLITINGGTTINVTETATNAAGTNVTAESDVTVNGAATTTSVSVTQAAVAAGASAVTGVAGVAGVAAVVAAPGTQAVAAVTAINAVDAVTAVAGITADGAVIITDSEYNTASANTITSVTLNNYGAGSIISDNALTSLALSGTAGTLRINNATNGADGVPTANTTLALTVNGLRGTNTVTDSNNEITTLNVTATGADSTLAAFADTGLTTLNLAGDKVLKLSAINGSLTSIAVTGAAGFNDGGTTAANGFAARGAAATLVTTSSGAITASLNSTTQTFVGSTGVDTIRISALANATQVITGGSSTRDELIVEGGAYALTAATGVKVTGFETLGVAANVTGTVDMSALATGFSGLHLIGNSTIGFSKVANGTALSLDVASSSVTVGTADTTGSADTISVTLGKATSDTVNFGTIVLKDANAVGVGTVNLVSNGVNITAGDSTANTNTVVLTDNGLSTLNVSGTQGLTITTINQATTQATSFTLNNTNTGSFGVEIGTFTDTVLGALNFTGSGLSKITTLTDASSSTLAISNTGTQLATIGTFTSSANLTNLTLNGNVQIGDGLVGGTGLTSTATGNVTVSGATDNAHVKLSLGLATVGNTHNITLGNGNNVITDATTAGTVNVSVGTGSNYLTLGGATTNTTGAFNVTLGAHTAADYITVGTGGTAYATAPNYVITGAATGDRIIFNTDAAATLVGHTAGVITPTTAGITQAATITALESAVDALAAHGVAYAVFGGNTYVAESISSTLGGTDTTIVEIIGSHTLTAATGYVTIAS